MSNYYSKKERLNDDYGNLLNLVEESGLDMSKQLSEADKLKYYLFDYLNNTSLSESQKKEIVVNTMMFMCMEILEKGYNV